MNFSLLLVPSLMFLPPLCSHINQKTQFENPVMEAKKKLSAETPPGAPGPAATPAGNCARNGDLCLYIVIFEHACDVCLPENLQSFTAAETFLRTGRLEEIKQDVAVVKWLVLLGCLLIIYHLWSLLPRVSALVTSHRHAPLSINTQRTITLAFKLACVFQP